MLVQQLKQLQNKLKINCERHHLFVFQSTLRTNRSHSFSKDDSYDIYCINLEFNSRTYGHIFSELNDFELNDFELNDLDVNDISLIWF